MVIVIEPHGTYAIYEQIVNQIKNQIVSGELAADEALPSIRGLAAEIGVSVITTKRAHEVTGGKEVDDHFGQGGVFAHLLRGQLRHIGVLLLRHDA